MHCEGKGYVIKHEIFYFMTTELEKSGVIGSPSSFNRLEFEIFRFKKMPSTAGPFQKGHKTQNILLREVELRRK